MTGVVTLLPPNATPFERSIEASLTRTVPVPVDLMWNPDRCPAPLLPWLAWALSVDDWSPDWSEAQQRAVIAASVDIHRHKGSMWSVREALRVMGYGDCDITEGWQTMVGGPWVVGNDPAPMRDLLAGSGGLAVEVDRATTATCFDATGAMVLRGPNEPRLDHDPVTGAPRGLLIEGAGSNVMPNSGKFAGWGTLNAIMSASARPAPLAGQTMMLLVETTAANNHQISAAWAMAVGTYTFSAHFAPAGRSRIGFTLTGGGLGTLVLTADLAAGTASILSGAGSARIVDCGGGVWRVAMSFAVTVAGAVTMRVRLRDAGGVDAYVGDGVSGAHLWGVQLEAGDQATSYIPTGAAPANRAADQLVLPARLGTRDVTITTAAGGLDLPGADMDGDLRPALAAPAHLQRIETSPAPGVQPVPVMIGDAGHWAEYFVRVRDRITPAMAGSIERRLASVAPARCRLTRIIVDAAEFVVGGDWLIGDEDVTIGGTYKIEEYL